MLRHRVRRIACRAVAVASVLAALPAAGPTRPLRRPAARPDEPQTILQGSAPADVDVLGIWITAARETFQRVRDYQCTFIKRERLDGALQEEQSAVLQVRQQPFSVHLRFVAPKSAAGREAIYVA